MIYERAIVHQNAFSGVVSFGVVCPFVTGSCELHYTYGNRFRCQWEPFTFHDWYSAAFNKVYLNDHDDSLNLQHLSLDDPGKKYPA